MTQKRLYFFLMAALLAVGLTGCGGSAEKPASSPQASAVSVVSVESSGTQDPSRTESSSAKESASSESTEKGLTEEELDQMSQTEERISSLCKTEAYKNASVGQRAEMAKQLLNELADEGLVIRDSIAFHESNISFQYRCGVLGGMKLKEWDPNMN